MDILQYELKMTSEEINDLGVTKITRPKKDNTEKIYIHCQDQNSAHYIFRKGARVSNEDIKISPFIPPQLYNRFNDLSKNTFMARKQDENLKTQI